MGKDTQDQYSAMNNGIDTPEGGSTTGDGTDANWPLGTIRTKVKEAQKHREADEWDERWEDFIKIYSNQYPYTQLSEYDDIIVPNMIFSTVNVIEPSIAVNNPKISVVAERQKDEQAAHVVETVVNHYWRAHDVQPEVRAAVKDFVIIGHGWVKVGWNSEDGEVDVPEWEYQAEIGDILARKERAIALDPSTAEDFDSDDDLIASVPTTRTQLVTDHPTARRISPFDMIVDPDSACEKDLRWICQRSLIPIEVAKANEDYQQSVRSKLKATSRSAARDNIDLGEDTTDDDEFVEVYEFYNLLTKTVCTFAEGTSGYLIKPTDSPFYGGHPFVFMPNFEVPERFYPIGDVETIFPLQVELGAVRSAQVADRKRGRRITLFREAALGNAGVEDLRAGKDNVMIPVIKDLPFADVFQQVSSVGLPPEWYSADQQAMADIDLVSGVSEYARGGQSEVRRTATEVGVIQDAANAKSADKLDKVYMGMAKVGERMIRLAQDFLEMDSVARITDEEGATQWVEFSQGDLEGDFFFDVEAGSTSPNNESFRRQQAQQLMDSFGALIGSGLLDDQYFIGQVLRLNGFNNVSKFMGPGIPPPPPPQPEGAPPADPAAAGMVPPPVPPQAPMAPPPGAPGPGMAGPAGGPELPPEIMAILEETLANGGSIEDLPPEILEIVMPLLQGGAM